MSVNADRAIHTVLFAVCAEPKPSAAAIAPLYALLMAGHSGDGRAFWSPINETIMAAIAPGEVDTLTRVRKLERVKRLAHRHFDKACEIISAG